MRGAVDATVLEAFVDQETEIVRRCALCGSERAQVLFTSGDRRHRQPGLFAFLRCDACGLGRLSPRPRQAILERYYPSDDYYAYQPEADRSGLLSCRAVDVRAAIWAAELLALGYPLPRHRFVSTGRKVLPRELWRRFTYGWEGIPRYVAGGRVLDIGCGNGAFLALLRQAGWEVVGVDASRAAARTARASFGIDVHTTTLEDAPLPQRGFDFIHMSHVIEHVEDPVTTLDQVARLLRPGGQLYIETPNVDSFSLKQWHADWLHVDSPRHLWMFSHHTLARALGEAGLTMDRLYGRGGFRFYRWEWTFQQEERQGRPLPRRPTVDPRAVPRLLALAAVGSLSARANPESGEVICCWAHLDHSRVSGRVDDQ